MTESPTRTAGERVLAKARARAGAARRKLTGAPIDTAQRLQRLERRLTEMENELMEARRLNRRLAELTDVVQELLLPADQRDEAHLRESLDRYSAGL